HVLPRRASICADHRRAAGARRRLGTLSAMLPGRALADMTRTFTSLCPHCGAEHVRTSQISEKDKRGPHEVTPASSDVVMCINCGRFSVMAKDGMLRRPTGRERRGIARDPMCKSVHAAWRMTRRPTTLEPHDYVPSIMHQGDCAICGHIQEAPIHR